MRTASMNLRGMRRTSHTVNVALLVAVFALSPLLLTNGQLYALDDDTAQTPSVAPGADTSEPTEDTAIRAPLQPGTPVSTTPDSINQARTMLTWTPTGIGDAEDTYDVIVSATPDTDVTGKLSGEPAASIEGTLVSEFGLQGQADGTYFWQVRSCMIVSACNVWSQPYAVTLDTAAPVTVTAAVTSNQYDTDVKLEGTAEAASKVTVRVGEYSCEATADETGMWKCSFEKFEYGTYEASIVSRDKASNEGPQLVVPFSVKELFVAKPIVTDEIPPVLDIVPADESPENKVYQQPVSTLDTVSVAEPEEQSILGTGGHLSTDGGIIQSSENGWQVFGMPWFIWVGSLGSMFAGLWALGWPVPRRLLSL